MTFQGWLLFCALEIALAFTPGPAVMLVVSQSLSRGARAGIAASLGILAANAAYFALSGTGLGAVLAASTEVFTIITWAGAAYLVWMGARMVFGRHATFTIDAAGGSARHAFRLAVVTQGANPKALVFFTAILPQFIDPHAAMLPQIVILGVTSVVLEFGVLGVYVGACHAARAWVARPSVVSALERVGGLFLIGAGIRLAIVRR